MLLNLKFFYGFSILIVLNGVGWCSIYLLVNRNRDVYCITNSSSGVAILPVRHPYQIKASRYYYPKVNIDLYTCDIANDPAPCNSDWENSDWLLNNSFVDEDADYILDRRWEEFDDSTSYYSTFYSYNRKGNYEIKNANFSIPLSISSNNETNIYLCEDSYTYNSNCYWFIINGFNKERSTLRKCLMDKTKLKPYTCNDVLILHQDKSINKRFSEQWEHFKIVKTGNTLQLWSRRFSEKPLIEYIDSENVLSVHYLMVENRFRSQFVKIHKVEYTSTTKEHTAYLGPVIRNSNNYLCLSMFVKMCKTCQMVLDFENAMDDEKQTFTSVNWTEIKYIVKDFKNKSFQLRVTTISTSEQSKKFWYIDSPRHCQESEYRIIESVETAPSESSIKCQLISEQEEIISVGKTSAKKASNNCRLNDRTRTIGSICLPCDFYGTSDCYSSKFCEKDHDGNVICTCGGSFTGENCEKSCKPGFYGYNCEKICGMCSSPCNTIDGTCRTCLGQYSGSHCDIAPNPPKVLKASYTYCSLQIDSSRGLRTPNGNVSYRLQYKKLEDSVWIEKVILLPQKSQNRYFLYGLLPDTSYLLRSETPPSDNSTYVKNSICKTLCKALKNDDIDINFTNITAVVTLKVQKYSCKISDCRLLGNYARQINNTTYEMLFLEPYHNYSLTFLKCGGAASLNVHFRTLEGIPNKVQNLQFYFQNTTCLGIRWRDPYPPTGILENFVAFMEENTTVIPLHKKCKVWSDYYCWEFIKPDIEIYDFEIEVAAKIKNFEEIGEVTQLNTEELLNGSSEVYKLTSEWSIDNHLTLSWNHPNYTYGNQIKFTIQISEQNSSNFLEETVEKQESEYNLTYYYTVQSKLMPSSLYNIHIFTLNEPILRTKIPRALSIISPPPIPEIYENPEIQRLNEKLSLKFSVKQEIYPLDKATCTIMISKEFSNWSTATFSSSPTINYKAVKILYSNNIKFNVMIFNITRDFYNKPINLHTKYTIAILLINEYKKQIRSRVYYLSIKEGENETDDLLPLITLVLLIPIIIFLIMKRRFIAAKFRSLRRKSQQLLNNTDSIEDNKELAVLSKKPKFIVDIQNETPRLAIPDTSTREVYNKRVKIIHFKQYVKDCIKNDEFQRQYALFFEESPIYEEVDFNDTKNDQNKIVTYDHTRVNLEKINDNDYTNCISANYIDGYKVARAYIATQSPQSNILYDFWRLIWEKKSEYIVMLANIYDDGKVGATEFEKKIEKYWPDMNNTLKVQDIIITYISNEVFADYEKREFAVVRNGHERKVIQLYFCAWPDDGVPLYSQSLVPFLQEILKIPLNMNSPIVIHCSTDDGTTGVVLLCDICLRMAAREGAIDVVNQLQKLRTQRSNLVDNIEQYKLAHLVILECLLGIHTTISCKGIEKNVDEFFKNNNNSIKKQMKYLIDTAWHDQAMKRNDSNDDNLLLIYREKNRLKHIIPEYHGRIFLSYYPSDNEQSSYINAVKVDGFRSSGRFIVTQQPLLNTLGDFWRLVDEQDISVIISLNEINLEDETSCQFWPKGRHFDLNPVNYIALKYLNDTKFDCYNLTNIQMSTQKSNQTKTKTINIVSMNQWHPKELLPNSVEEFMMFWEECNTICRRSQRILVTCYDGVTASGIYVAISFIIEKMKLEQNCDVCQAVRTIRRNRNEFITSESQFKFLYEGAVQYIKGFQSYANFH